MQELRDNVSAVFEEYRSEREERIKDVIQDIYGESFLDYIEECIDEGRIEEAKSEIDSFELVIDKRRGVEKLFWDGDLMEVWPIPTVEIEYGDESVILYGDEGGTCR